MSEEEVVEAPEVTEEVSEPTPEGIEVIAREYGWKPEDEWKGNPPKDGFKSAHEFVKDGLAIQKTEHTKISRLEQQMDKLVEGEAKRLRTALESQKDRLLAERQQAFEEADADKFNEVDEKLRETEKELESQPELSPLETEFRSQNDWFEQDRTMTAFAHTIAQGLKQAYPNLSEQEFYNEIETAVKAQFPNKFVNERRSAGSAVEGNAPASKKPKKNNFDSLPPEAKQAFEELKYVNPKLTEDSYAKGYFEMENN